MGIRDFFRRSVAHENELRWYDPNVIPRNSLGYGSSSGEFVSERTALQMATVYSCVRLLADSIASLPIDVYRSSNGTRIPLASPLSITLPNPELNGDFEHVQQVVSSLALRGNSYEHIIARDKFEYPLARETVHPDDIMVSRNRVDGRPDYQIHGVSVPRADVLHIRRLTLAGGIMGLSPIEMARQGIGLSLAAERYGAHWFGDSADPSSVLETDTNLPDAEAQRVMKSWVSTNGGRRHPAVLSGGLKYRPIAISPNESQFLETRSFQRSEIAMIFGVPPHMIGDTAKSTSWGTGIEQQKMGYVQFSLLPWLRCIETAWSQVLLPRGQYVRFNLDSLLRGDTATRYGAYVQARNAGWLSVNEVREKEDMPPVPNGGDDFLQPLNMGILGETPAPPPADPPPSVDAVNPADAGGGSE